MKQKHIRVAKSKLSYYKQGTGDRFMLMFHGYGQDGMLFSNLPESYLKEYTCFAIDLFGHGDSSFFYKEKIETGDLKLVLVKLLQDENIERFSVLGFSLGGRVAINATFELKNKVDELILLAPDGVVDSFVFKAATSDSFLKSMFKRMVFFPTFYQRAIQLVKKLNIIDSSSIDFVERVMSTRSRRYRLYRVWNMHAGLTVTLKQLSESGFFAIRLYLAKNDRFVDSKKVMLLCDKIKMPYKLLRTGHFQIVKEYFSIYTKESQNQ